MSDPIARLVALSGAAGVAPAMTRDADGVAYTATRRMPEAVREAAWGDPALAYIRSADNEAPQEGFVDEAAETYLFYPLDPAHDVLADIVAAHNRPARRAPLLGGVVGLLGLGFIGRSLLHPDGYVALRAGTGVLFVIAAALLLRRRPAVRA